jgi:putative PIN family toxin of toxin-antitoxin system
MLTVLIDTNVMMVALSPKSDLHWLYLSFIKGEFKLVVSNEIVLEYEEQLRYRYNDSVVAEFLLILSEAVNVIHHEPYFKWNLIKADTDDNKFVDAAISSSADYIITHDKHFDILRQNTFPIVNIINAYEFKNLLTQQ